MSKINYQALREAAERAIPAMERLLMLPVDDDLLSEQELKDYGVDIDALNAFKFLTGPETVLALLDERERNQQYIKRRDQENEDIALTVGKLRVELEGKDSKIANLTAERDALREGEMGDARHSNTRAAADIYFQLVEECEIPAGGSLVEYVDDMREKLEAAEKRIAELEAEPVSQAYNLPELIEGMEVSIDVSTCDADLGNRYFGTVTEALELDTAKNGYILLVQDAEPNFDVNGNYQVIPSEVLSAILKVAKIRADFDDFDGDRRGIGDCLDEAEQELIFTINKYASQLAAEPIATNDVREQTAVPPVPEIQADVAQAIENLKQKLVECNRYNYCADAVKGVEDACRAVSYSQADNQPASGNQAAESNRGNEWTGNPDIDNAIIMLDRIDTAESCDDERIEAVKAVLRRLAGNYPVTPDGWISCSERMPNDAQWCVVDAADGYYVQCWSEGQGWLGDDISLRNCDVIRWMPIPEPPQEVK